MNKDEARNAADFCCRNVNCARSMYGDVFASDAFVLDGNQKDSSVVQGRGNWDYLVVLPFTGSADEVLCTMKNMWNCPDSEPYVQDGHVVWEFPPSPFVLREENESAAVLSEKGESVTSMYTAGFFPPCFDDYISRQDGTDYSPDSSRESNNLNADKCDAYWYLGNYFPRSFVESFCIYDYIFTFGIDAILGTKPELTICDVGVGSGGATYGLIWALRKRLLGNSSFKKVRVIGLDGNENTLKIFRELKPVIEKAWPIEFEFLTREVRFSSTELIPDEIMTGEVDFVITSKCLQELGADSSATQSLYERFLKEALRILSEDGLISVVEIDNRGCGAALENVFRSLNEKHHVVVAPRQDGGCLVGRAKMALSSTRIEVPEYEDIIFAVIGSQELAKKFPKWDSPVCPTVVV